METVHLTQFVLEKLLMPPLLIYLDYHPDLEDGYKPPHPRQHDNRKMFKVEVLGCVYHL